MELEDLSILLAQVEEEEEISDNCYNQSTCRLLQLPLTKDEIDTQDSSETAATTLATFCHLDSGAGTSSSSSSSFPYELPAIPKNVINTIPLPPLIVEAGPTQDLHEIVRKQNSTITHMRDELFLMNNQIELLKNDLHQRFSSIDLKKAKKNRTQINRCTFKNRKNGTCRGYICKINGSQLCYAHHIMATADENPSRRAKLY